ncbi:MAG: gliding motility-associated C-terminal domain-containing protein [Saprospiraceae bacterium]|nr:gliding motility-associated C-terminal domain-containing protein [Saprospiraceae bacterium]
MKKLITILIILAFTASMVSGQQIKRSTLTSVGKLKTIEPFRVSWTAGSCPGCNVLHPLNPPNSGYLRQGFQQPTFNGNSPDCPSLTPSFTITPIVSPVCGTKFDMEYTGISVLNMVVEWNFGDGAFPQTSNELNPSGVFYSTPGLKIVTLKVSRGLCTESRARTINVTNNQIGLAATAIVTDVKCRNDKTGGINITPVGGVGAKTYRWSTGATSQNLTNVAAGRYKVTATDANGCTFSLDTVITQPSTVVSFTAEIIAETCKDYEDGSIQLAVNGGTKPYNVLWSTGETTTGILSLVAGKYSVTIKDTNNCRIDTAFLINRRCRDTSKFQVYDVITPNGDGKNDKWVIANIEKYPNNEVFIYNRWGQLVYQTTKYRNDWEGTNQDGKELPTAAYYYIIRLNDPDNTVWNGSVSILR